MSRRRMVLGVTVLFVAVASVLGAGVEERLSAGGFHRRDAESFWTVEVASPLVLHPLSNRAGSAGLVVATIPGGEDAALDAVEDLSARYSTTIDGFEVSVGGPLEVAHQVREQAKADLARAELMIAPFTLTALFVVFAGVVAAFLPLGVAVVAVLGTFLVLTVVSGQTEVSIFARVLTTALGVGLGVDYSLFVVARFREELATGQSVAGAVHRVIDTAGRTVIISAGTVVASLSALFLFPIDYLQSFAFAGVSVVALAAVTAVVVLPAFWL